MQNKEAVILRLELIAAKAKQLAEDVKHEKLWPGQLQNGLSEINSQLSILTQDARDDR